MSVTAAREDMWHFQLLDKTSYLPVSSHAVDKDMSGTDVGMSELYPCLQLCKRLSSRAKEHETGILTRSPTGICGNLNPADPM